MKLNKCSDSSDSSNKVGKQIKCIIKYETTLIQIKSRTKQEWKKVSMKTSKR